MTTPAQDLLSWSITALQLAANMSTAAAQVSNLLAKMAAEGRDTPTPDEWAVLDAAKAAARRAALET